MALWCPRFGQLIKYCENIASDDEINAAIRPESDKKSILGKSELIIVLKTLFFIINGNFYTL